MSKEEKTPETKAEEYVETEFENHKIMSDYCSP